VEEPTIIFGYILVVGMPVFVVVRKLVGHKVVLVVGHNRIVVVEVVHNLIAVVEVVHNLIAVVEVVHNLVVDYKVVLVVVHKQVVVDHILR
jgi:uncharacterized membrane protein YpjA